MLKSWDLERKDKTIKKKKKERKGVCRKISEVMNPHPEGGCDQKEADTWSRQVGKPGDFSQGPHEQHRLKTVQEAPGISENEGTLFVR